MFDFIKDQSTTELSKAGAQMFITDVDTGQVMSLKLKGDKAPKPMFVTLLGPESYQVRQALIAAAARLKDEREGGEMSEEEFEAIAFDDAKMLSEITVGGQVVLNGKWVEVDAKVAYQLYSNVASLRAQATRFAAKLGNFKKAS